MLLLSDFLQVRESRDPEAARSCLAAIEECARTREGNLLALAVEAARARSERRSLNVEFNSKDCPSFTLFSTQTDLFLFEKIEMLF